MTLGEAFGAITALASTATALIAGRLMWVNLNGRKPAVEVKVSKHHSAPAFQEFTFVVRNRRPHGVDVQKVEFSKVNGVLYRKEADGYGDYGWHESVVPVGQNMGPDKATTFRVTARLVDGGKTDRAIAMRVHFVAPLGRHARDRTTLRRRLHLEPSPPEEKPTPRTLKTASPSRVLRTS